MGFNSGFKGLISASSLLIGSTSKAFWKPFRFPPPVAIRLRLNERRHNMLTCHRIVLTRRKHTVILSLSAGYDLKHRVESHRKKIVDILSPSYLKQRPERETGSSYWTLTMTIISSQSPPVRNAYTMLYLSYRHRIAIVSKVVSGTTAILYIKTQSVDPFINRCRVQPTKCVANHDVN